MMKKWYYKSKVGNQKENKIKNRASMDIKE
jgi:hypothetical protein